MSSSDATQATPDVLPVDARLVEPNTRYEILDGVLVHVPPADPPHGMRHAKLAALVDAHAGNDFVVAVDMLTRTSRTNDFAPDVSVFPAAPDPVTGGRQLEHLAFEIASTQSLSRAGDKAAKLIARGVRRVFAIDVERSRALEWSVTLDTWSVLESAAHIEDRALAAPLPIAALLHAARADDVVARALILKRNPEIEAVRAQDRMESLLRGRAEGLLRGRAEGRLRGREEGKQEGVAEGLVRGTARAILAILAARRIAIEPAARDRILAERDPDRLDRWLVRATICSGIDEILESPADR